MASMLSMFDGLDARLLRALRVPRLRESIRGHPTGAVLLLLAVWASAFALNASGLPDRNLIATGLSVGLFFLVFAMFVVVAMAVVDDMNAAGRRGWLWGLLVIVGNVVALAAWIIVRKREARHPSQ